MQNNSMISDGSAYADCKVSKPIYDYTTGKFIVKYQTEEKGAIKWEQKSFKTRLEALHFYVQKYEEYVYTWTLMFYNNFKNSKTL